MNNTLLLNGPDEIAFIYLYIIQGLVNTSLYSQIVQACFILLESSATVLPTRNIMLWMARWMLQEKESHFVCSCLLLWVSLCPSGGGWCWCWLLTDCPWLRNTEPLTSLVPGDHTLHPPELTTLSWLPAASPGHCCKDVKSDPPTPPSCLDSHPHGCQLISCQIFNNI